MKKCISLFVCCIMLLSISACGDSGHSSSDQISPPSQSSELQEPPKDLKSSKNYDIIYITPQTINPYFLNIYNGWQAMA